MPHQYRQMAFGNTLVILFFLIAGCTFLQFRSFIHLSLDMFPLSNGQYTIGHMRSNHRDPGSMSHSGVRMRVIEKTVFASQHKRSELAETETSRSNPGTDGQIILHSSDSSTNREDRQPTVRSYDKLPYLPLPENMSCFKPRISEAEHTIMNKLLDTFFKVCRTNHIEYMLYGGTLIGARRYHGMLPWDDDFDVITNVKNRPLLEKILFNVPGYGLESRRKPWIAFYKAIAHKPGYRWPYIDIFFYIENATHISEEYFHLTKTWPKQHVFPLWYMPFEAGWQPVPKHIDMFNHQTYIYNVDTVRNCQCSRYNHRLHRATGQTFQVPCERLKPYFPFVESRTEGGGIIVEELWGNGSLIHTFSRTRSTSSTSNVNK